MTVFTDNVEAFATRADVAIDMERRSTVQLATLLILDGKPGRAQYEMARSVMRQCRMAGLGSVSIDPVVP